MRKLIKKSFSLLAVSAYSLVIHAQDYSGRHDTEDTNSSGGAFVLFILLLVGGFYLFSFVATIISEYSIKQKQEKIRREKENKRRQMDYITNPHHYYEDMYRQMAERDKEPEFLGIGCGCWGFISGAIVFFVIPMIKMCASGK